MEAEQDVPPTPGLHCLAPASQLSPFPFQIVAKVFSRGALGTYLPRLQDVIKSEIAKWCSEPGAIDVYAAARSLTFRIAVGVLLGLQLEEDRIVYLAQIFEQLMNNLFSLPVDAPLSGLRKVRARQRTNQVTRYEKQGRATSPGLWARQSLQKGRGSGETGSNLIIVSNVDKQFGLACYEPGGRELKHKLRPVPRSKKSP